MEKDKQILIRVRAIIFNDGKLLGVKHPHNTSFVALPGGHLEWGEDLKGCLSREIVEELGVKPDVGRLFYVHTFTQKDNKHYIEFFFEVKNGKDYLDIGGLSRSHAEEIAEIVWVSPADDVRILPRQFAEDFKVGKIVSDEVKYIRS
jgi:ADP-ribose pyrophosphatase YjhB (NUDIX family)